jgi:hypothetical protein
MKLLARKNKGHKLVDDDDMEEEEQDFDEIEKGKSVKSAVLVAKDENALIYRRVWTGKYSTICH